MRIAQLGTGEPELVIVGGIHGDEPCGVRAVEWLLEAEPEVARPVRLIVANERAIDAGVRYVDADLNRSFDYVSTKTAYEAGLADRLRREIQGKTVLSIHSTQSTHDPFAIVSGLSNGVEPIVSRLSVEAVVDAGPLEDGRIFDTSSTVIEVEAGYQGSETATANAKQLAEEFLVATGALPGDLSATERPLFEMGKAIQKPPAEDYEVFVNNFNRVDQGETFARADQQRLQADEEFWPVLLSAYGYRDIFGYRGRKQGSLSPA
ncbi:succinylglutamate desuccinylase/aspartoacylase [Halodesulfurarchaeum formicicum]|uniref:Succinylglutamate desuccinylase/aspartoacylase n=1 Tax=Halodesulfurarchaeum formicicum TaxID=1873524 RepID=A0A1D8S3D3_9EURY|nr:succinylglutamate desuccinylase/aspartoacylase family protein [Halodesulfurarchaeum formicicum]AOW79855.1 succinylglutamate desuccinylase/aspartoacylase [Halodesulfurarchaeum formicicum]APE95148.1 succinylglutamate desuccinylase/aspartoacylase [Halodesulfurarchaeum formicicum]